MGRKISSKTFSVSRKLYCTVLNEHENAKGTRKNIVNESEHRAKPNSCFDPISYGGNMPYATTMILNICYWPYQVSITCLLRTRQIRLPIGDRAKNNTAKRVVSGNIKLKNCWR